MVQNSQTSKFIVFIPEDASSLRNLTANLPLRQPLEKCVRNIRRDDMVLLANSLLNSLAFEVVYEVDMVTSISMKRRQ